MWALTIFFAIRLFSGLKQDPYFNLKKIFILIQLILFIPLFIIAHDYGRWIFIWSSSSCLLFSLIISIFKKESIHLETKAKRIKIMGKLFPVIKNQRNYNIVILLLGLPHCCWSLGRYLISNPIDFLLRTLFSALSGTKLQIVQVFQTSFEDVAQFQQNNNNPTSCDNNVLGILSYKEEANPTLAAGK